MPAAAQAAVAQAAQNYGLPGLALELSGSWCRGCTVTAAVTVEIPAVQVPMIGTIGDVVDSDVIVPRRGLRIAMTRTVSARRAQDDRGSITLLMIGSTMIVMFVGWIAFTMWNGSNERRQLAAAADQAAQAGATALDAAAFRPPPALASSTPPPRSSGRSPASPTRTSRTS